MTDATEQLPSDILGRGKRQVRPGETHDQERLAGPNSPPTPDVGVAELVEALRAAQGSLLFEAQRALVARAAEALTASAARVREAFRSGWYVNAAVDDQSAEYLAGCEEVDWREHQRDLAKAGRS